MKLLIQKVIFEQLSYSEIFPHFQPGFELELPTVCSVILENCLYFFKFSTGYSCIFLFYMQFTWNIFTGPLLSIYSLIQAVCFGTWFLLFLCILVWNQRNLLVFCHLKKTIFRCEKKTLFSPILVRLYSSFFTGKHGDKE